MTNVIDPKLVYDAAREIASACDKAEAAKRLLAFLLINSNAQEFVKDETERGWEFTFSHTVVMDDEMAFCALQDATRSVFEAQRA